jgi:peptidoglycan L-alanyl-D-glutamate endopeptidase CwlK
MYKLGRNSAKNLIGVDPRWIEIVKLALTLTQVDFGIPGDGGVRTAARQNEMFLDPGIETKCDGYINISNHQSGKSIDIFAYVDGAASWVREYLLEAAASIFQAASILGHKIEWGGLWPWDAPHFNLLD